MCLIQLPDDHSNCLLVLNSLNQATLLRRKMLWHGLGHWTIAAETLRVLDQLLVVLMLVEILHTVRISIRSHFLVTEPFLVLGLIAAIRRILVITLEAANLTKVGAFAGEGANIFRATMVELGLLGARSARPRSCIFDHPLASIRTKPQECPRPVKRLGVTMWQIVGVAIALNRLIRLM
jgi:hypothetical protein